MAEKRSYRQNCALAHAMDLVGERWTLLIVRELLVGERRYGELVAQKALGRQRHERFARRAQGLSAQHVEHLRGGRRHADLHVVFGA